MTVTEARAALPRILELVLAGEEVTLTRHGEPVAVVLRPDRLRSRRTDAAFAEAERVHELLERGRRSGLRALPRLSAEHAEELLADLRAARERR